MKGNSDTLEVFEDKLTLTPRGIAGLIYRGLKATKTIPFTSIQAFKFKKSGLLSGYFQFTIAGAFESSGGLIAATFDKNSFKFERQNKMALKIKEYIERRIRELKASGSLSDLPAQIKKLADMRDKGSISEEEFQSAKTRLIGNVD